MKAGYIGYSVSTWLKKYCLDQKKTIFTNFCSCTHNLQVRLMLWWSSRVFPLWTSKEFFLFRKCKFQLLNEKFWSFLYQEVQDFLTCPNQKKSVGVSKHESYMETNSQKVLLKCMGPSFIYIFEKTFSISSGTLNIHRRGARRFCKLLLTKIVSQYFFGHVFTDTLRDTLYLTNLHSLEKLQNVLSSKFNEQKGHNEMFCSAKNSLI